MCSATCTYTDIDLDLEMSKGQTAGVALGLDERKVKEKSTVCFRVIVWS